MRGVFSRTTTALLLLAVLAAPSALALEPTGDTSLWAEFEMWLESRIGVPGGVTFATEADFATWLMSRLVIPGG